MLYGGHSLHNTHSFASIPESVADDPWKLLIAVMLLNKTWGKQAIPVFWDILDRWETPEALSQGENMFHCDSNTSTEFCPSEPSGCEAVHPAVGIARNSEQTNDRTEQTIYRRSSSHGCSASNESLPRSREA